MNPPLVVHFLSAVSAHAFPLLRKSAEFLDSENTWKTVDCDPLKTCTDAEGCGLPKNSECIYEIKKEELEVEGTILALVDSGASAHCGPKQLFRKFTGEQVTLKVADRVLEEQAEVGFFRKNDAGMVMGLCHPKIDRLIMSTEEKVENEEGIVHFEKGNSFVRDGFGRKRVVVRKNGLPHVAIAFSGESLKDISCLEWTALGEAHANLTEKQSASLRQHERNGHMATPDFEDFAMLATPRNPGAFRTRKNVLRTKLR